MQHVVFPYYRDYTDMKPPQLIVHPSTGIRFVILESECVRGSKTSFLPAECRFDISILPEYPASLCLNCYVVLWQTEPGVFQQVSQW